MEQTLTRDDVKNILLQLRSVTSKDDCWSCGCLQGLATQLQLDAEADISDLIEPLEPDAAAMHGCLGCDPCPRADLFAEYVRSKTETAPQ